MQRIHTLLQKITELSKLDDKAGLIEIDLMMDYTRVIYADLAEMRNRANFVNTVPVKEQISLPVVTVQEETVVKAIEPNPIPVTTPSIPATPVTQQEKDIQSLIGINDKYQYISELFGNDKEAYEYAITRINAFTSATEAIDWVADNYGWDDENETAQSFYDLLKSFYNS